MREVLWDIREMRAQMLLDRWGSDEGAAFYVHVNDFVAECQADIAKGDRRPHWLADLEELADELEDEFGSHTEATSWDDFLHTHPELTAEPEQPILPRLEFDDDDVIEALNVACQQWSEYANEHHRNPDHNYAWAACVAAVLRCGRAVGRAPAPEERYSHSDVVRVGQALGRLAREGRIRFASEPGQRSRRYAPLAEGGA